MPLLTLVFYYGEDQAWDGPVSLHEMLLIPKELELWKTAGRKVFRHPGIKRKSGEI